MNASVNNFPQKRQMSSSGFTLIELMVTIAVLAIIVSIAAPNISTQLANQRVKSTAATLANALKEAKVESVIRRQNVEVIYDAITTPKTLTLRANNNDIASYNINAQSVITPNFTPSNVVFQPSNTIVGGASILYIVCDSSASSETPKQVRVTNIATIEITNAGSC